MNTLTRTAATLAAAAALTLTPLAALADDMPPLPTCDVGQEAVPTDEGYVCGPADLANPGLEVPIVVDPPVVVDPAPVDPAPADPAPVDEPDREVSIGDPVGPVYPEPVAPVLDAGSAAPGEHDGSARTELAETGNPYGDILPTGTSIAWRLLSTSLGAVVLGLAAMGLGSRPFRDWYAARAYVAARHARPRYRRAPIEDTNR